MFLACLTMNFYLMPFFFFTALLIDPVTIMFERQPDKQDQKLVREPGGRGQVDRPDAFVMFQSSTLGPL